MRSYILLCIPLEPRDPTANTFCYIGVVSFLTNAAFEFRDISPGWIHTSREKYLILFYVFDHFWEVNTSNINIEQLNVDYSLLLGWKQK